MVLDILLVTVLKIIVSAHLQVHRCDPYRQRPGEVPNVNATRKVYGAGLHTAVLLINRMKVFSHLGLPIRIRRIRIVHRTIWIYQ